MLKRSSIKKFIIVFIFLSAGSVVNLFACELCKKNQPEVLEGITHGTGPQGNTDYIIIWTAVVIVGFAFLLSLKFLILPGEKNPEHIKNIVLE